MRLARESLVNARTCGSFFCATTSLYVRTLRGANCYVLDLAAGHDTNSDSTPRRGTGRPVKGENGIWPFSTRPDGSAQPPMWNHAKVCTRQEWFAFDGKEAALPLTGLAPAVGLPGWYLLRSYISRLKVRQTVRRVRLEMGSRRGVPYR